MVSEQRPLRVLILYRALFRARDEALEVRELIAGVAEARRRGQAVAVTNGREVFEPRLVGDAVELDHIGRFDWRRADYDVVHVHLALPRRHLVWAWQMRLRGVSVVLSPMAMLGDDFATKSWFRPASRMWLLVKPWLVRVYRFLWNRVAAIHVCASEEEVRQGRLPRKRVVLAPLAAPDSPVAVAARGTQLPGDTPPAGPVAFTTRFDVHRKGIDRLWAWVEAQREALPRPAVLLLAPSDEPAPPELQALIDDGLVEWDPVSRGADLLPQLARCRGQMLLSRYDGQPRVLREAAVLGLPTISTVASHFASVVSALGTGAIVDGDDPASVQAAYDALPTHPRRTAEARTLFGRAGIGAYLWEVYAAAARDTVPAVTSYYDRYSQGPV